MQARPDRRRVSVHAALPGTKIFVALAGSEVVGTVTLIPDSPAGLPMDEIYAEELEVFRRPGRRIAEVSALAVSPQSRSAVGPMVLFGLLRLMVVYAAEVGTLNDLCILVHPRHAAFYREYCHFRAFGRPKRFAKVAGAPAVPLHLDLAVVRQLILDVHARGRQTDDFYEFFFGEEACREVRGIIRREASLAPPSWLPAYLASYVSAEQLRLLAAPGAGALPARSGPASGRAALPRPARWGRLVTT
jgi:hypothetical protein